MFDWFNLHIASMVVTALLFGGMTTFAFFFTPLVFQLSEREDAATFLRRLFPIYDRVGCGVAIVAALPLLPGQSYGPEVVTLLSVAALFLIAARVLVPATNSARESGADGRWRLLHRLSVLLHTGQLIAVLVVFIRLAA
jgi:hypothetical protein